MQRTGNPLGSILGSHLKYVVPQSARQLLSSGHLQGCVRDLLDDQESPLSWPQRVHIAMGAAWGLRYLHDYFDPPFMHRDFKTSNILVAADGKVIVALWHFRALDFVSRRLIS